MRSFNLADSIQRPQKRPGYVTDPHRDAQKAVVIGVETVGCMVSGVMVGYGPCATARMALRLCTIPFRVWIALHWGMESRPADL